MASFEVFLGKCIMNSILSASLYPLSWSKSLFCKSWTGYFFSYSNLIVISEYIKDLTHLEKGRNLRPSPEIDAFMKVYLQNSKIYIDFIDMQPVNLYPYALDITWIAQASSIGGKKHSISTDYILKVLGLDICADTIVGSDMMRGVSGGQRKRVTTGLHPILVQLCGSYLFSAWPVHTEELLLSS